MLGKQTLTNPSIPKFVETTNSFKILRHPDIFVYRTESADDRRMFLAVVRKAVDDFATERKRQLEGLGAALSGSKVYLLFTVIFVYYSDVILVN